LDTNFSKPAAMQGEFTDPSIPASCRRHCCAEPISTTPRSAISLADPSWRGRFGKPTWSFDHKGVHFIGMNSILVRDFWTAAGMTAKQRMDTMEMLESPIAGPWGVREEQLEWLKKDVKALGTETPVVVFTHSRRKTNKTRFDDDRP
jgi:hypothetical protein